MNLTPTMRNQRETRWPMAVAVLTLMLVSFAFSAPRATAQASPTPQPAPITNPEGIRNSPYELRDPAKGIYPAAISR